MPSANPYKGPRALGDNNGEARPQESEAANTDGEKRGSSNELAELERILNRRLAVVVKAIQSKTDERIKDIETSIKQIKKGIDQLPKKLEVDELGKRVEDFNKALNKLRDEASQETYLEIVDVALDRQVKELQNYLDRSLLIATENHKILKQEYTEALAMLEEKLNGFTTSQAVAGTMVKGALAEYIERIKKDSESGIGRINTLAEEGIKELVAERKKIQEETLTSIVKELEAARDKLKTAANKRAIIDTLVIVGFVYLIADTTGIINLIVGYLF